MNLRQVKKKIKTIGNVKKITRAMELVAAVKMKKSQQAAIESKPYHDALETVIKKVVSVIDPSYSVFLEENNAQKNLIILITTSKGMCGAFNFNLFREMFGLFKTENIDYITIGKKGAYFVQKIGKTVIADFSGGKAIDAPSAIFDLSVEKYLKKEYKQVYLVYNRFISATKQLPVKEMILPVRLEKEMADTEVKKLSENYKIEPSPEKIINPLLKNFVEEKIRNAIISSDAGEQSARMLAMKAATDNANDLIYELTLMSNKLRQEKITNELLDMVTAKESVEN